MSENRIAQVVPKGGLNRFISSFANLTRSEDLADDSDSDDDDEINRTSGDTFQVKHLDDVISMLNGVCSICLPQIEHQLFEPLGSAKSVDTVMVRPVAPQYSYIIFTNLP